MIEFKPGYFRLACGHFVRCNPWDPYGWFTAARTPCMRCYLEAKVAAKSDRNSA